MDNNRNLRMEKVIRSKRKQEIKELYLSAFAKEDRMPFGLMLAMSCLWNTGFYAFYDRETLCGMIYLASMGRQTFIMFFAVPEKLRSHGYGSRILSAVQEMYPENKIIVSIEPCAVDAENYGQRIRRKAFYAANGYNESGYMMKLYGIDQEILIKNGAFEKGRFVRFFMLYSNCAVIPKIWKTEP